VSLPCYATTPSAGKNGAANVPRSPPWEAATVPDQAELPAGLVEARRTPLFDFESMPAPIATSHRTTVWATLHVQEGDVDYADLEGDEPRHERLDAGDSIVIPPWILHRVDPSTDARFFVQFYREPHGGPIPELYLGPPPSPRAEGPWQHRGRDLDSPEEIFEMVTRQYAVVVQDEVLEPHFTPDDGFIDWQALIGSVSDFWNHVLLYAPDYPIDPIERHRAVHERRPLTGEALNRWLEVFHETVDTGWSGPTAETAKKRGTGIAWAMAQRLLGHGVWRPTQHHRT
jgi:hemoglobin